LAGTTAGLTLRRLLSADLQALVRTVIGLFTAVIGIQMALQTRNPLVLLVGLLTGALIGEALRLDHGLKAMGDWAQRRLRAGDSQSTVSLAFVTTSILFCVGPLTVLGTFQDGTKGDITLLAIKSILDGFSSIVFAASLGWGVYLSAGTVLLVQGGLTAIAFFLQGGLGKPETAELSAAGGVAVLAIALGLLELKTIRVANLLPSLVTAPLLAAILHAFKLLS
jgi:uncharacterized membrane protein YqgA involved in biofilm formation